MKFRKSAALLFLFALAVLLAANAQARTWKISHVRPQDTAIDKDLKWFADQVEQATNGEITMKIYAASSLGDYTVVQERVSMGAVDMACQPPTSKADKRFQLVYFPYMVQDWEQAQKNYSSGAPLRKTISELYARQGIHVLAAWPVYFGGISLNTEPVAPGDPDTKKGIKVRVPPMKSFKLLADNIGYMGTPIPFSDAFTSVQTGVVDGVIGSGAEGYYASFRDVTKYYIPANTHFEVWYLIINERMYNDLDSGMQQELDQVAQRFEERRWETAQADQAANEQKLADYGAEIVELTPEQIASYAQIAQEEVWPKILEDVGTEWGQKVLDQVVK